MISAFSERLHIQLYCKNNEIITLNNYFIHTGTESKRQLTNKKKLIPS